MALKAIFVGIVFLWRNPQSLIATVAEQFGASRCIRPSRRFAV